MSVETSRPNHEPIPCDATLGGAGTGPDPARVTTPRTAERGGGARRVRACADSGPGAGWGAVAGLGACERFSNETWRGGWAPEVVGAAGLWGSVDEYEVGRIWGATAGRASTRRGEARAGEAEEGPWYAGGCGADGDETEAWERGEMAREGKEEGRAEGREEAMAESEDVDESGGRELAGSG
jgi:hypothetical protein